MSDTVAGLVKRSAKSVPTSAEPAVPSAVPDASAA
jgi:hypothetical protein